MNSETKLILCPYCGQTQPHADRCSTCGGMFEPLSRMATQIAMGPWFLRDTANPYRPGCCYDALKKMAKEGKIKPATVMRGPTTHQFWSLARNTPGVSHLVGYCHRCATRVQPDHVACPECAAMFMDVPERNELGLHYSTANAASKAQKALTQQVSARQESINNDPDNTEPTDQTQVNETLKTEPDSSVQDATPVDPNTQSVSQPEPEPPVTGEAEDTNTQALSEAGVQTVDAEHQVVDVEVETHPETTAEGEALAQQLADTPANTQRYVPYPNRWTTASVWLLVAVVLLGVSLVSLFVTHSGIGQPNSAYSAQSSRQVFNDNPQWRQPTAQAITPLLRDIADRAELVGLSETPGMRVAAVQQYNPLSGPEMLANRIARVDNLIRIGRLHEALITLEAIARSMPGKESHESVERVIKALENQIHQEDMPSFFGVPIE